MDLTPTIAYAASQHHVVARWELIDMGWRSRDIARALEAGELTHVHDTVYVAGDAELTWHGRCMAATLVYPGSVISHLTAAMLHGLWPIDEDRAIDIAIPDNIDELAGPVIARRALERAAIRAAIATR